MQQATAKLKPSGVITAVISAWLIVCSSAAARLTVNYAPGPQVLTFFSVVDNSDQPYALYLPKDFQPTKRYPLVVALHGAGANHRLALRRVFGVSNWTEDGRGGFPALPAVDYIIAAPFGRGSMGYQGVAEQDVYDMLADVQRRFPVDEDRVYLTGESMGGSGTLQLGLTRPDLWAALAPVCGGAPGGTEELAPNALNLPVKITHGDQDQTVPITIARGWRERFTSAGVKLDYREYAGFDHNVWDVTYKDGAIFAWFAQHRRQRFPQRVRFVTPNYQHNAAYWVEFDSLTPGTPAQLDARFVARNQIEITTAALDGFTLKLAGHPRFDAAQPLRLKLDGTELQVTTGGGASFTKEGARWKAARCVLPAGVKRGGAEGPVFAAISARHIYVYGTADRPDEAELQRRRAEAATAADWAGPRARPNVVFPILADSEVKESDLRQAHLILFGTRQTNSLIARYAAQFPLELKPGAPGYGLLFIAPIGERYAVVCSGLPWWTHGAQAGRASFRWQWLALPYRLLLSFGDYVVFKGSIENVIAEGRFDRQWKTPAAEAARIRAIDAITVR